LEPTGLSELFLPQPFRALVLFHLRKPVPLFLGLALCLLGCGDLAKKPELHLIDLQGKALGTTWSITILSHQTVTQDDLKSEISAELKKAEKVFSHWRPDATLYQFNATLSTEPQRLEPPLLKLLKHAKWMHRETNGALDPTLAPVVNLWGFGPVTSTRNTIPTRDEVEGALSLTGLGNLMLLPDGRAQKKFPALQLDLSASAKGEIIDLLCDLLDRWNFRNYLVEIGGEVRGQGKGKNGEGWVVGLEDGSGDTDSMTAVTLRNYAVATSGSYRLNKPNPNSNRNASHLIDPRTGRPVEHDLIAVNAFAPTARDADAWATALMILGPEEGMKMAEKMDMVARFCVLKDGKVLILKSTAYDRIFRKLTPN
jgi:thiamine biosynthesis lipoprotein